MSSEKFGIVGAGVMGAGISEDLLEHGFSVVLIDVSETVLETAKARIRRSIRARAMFKKAHDPQRTKKMLDGLTLSTRYESLGDVDLVVENVNEEIELKKSVYKLLDSSCKPNSIIIANTSCIPITRLASYTEHPEQVIGVHFMNPVPLKSTVELIPGSHGGDHAAHLRFLGETWEGLHRRPGFTRIRVEPRVDADDKRGHLSFARTGL